MDCTNSIINYRRYLKRRNLSPCTIRNYLNSLKQFLAWLKVPIEVATHHEISSYIEWLQHKRKHPKTINCQIITEDGLKSEFNITPWQKIW